jgi:hypothetical protein
LTAGGDGGTLAAVDPALKGAYDFAARAHAGQVRKGGQAPYILHPAAVATILREAGVEEAAVLRAALLHDIVENTPRTVADIAAEFGPTIADLVAELTRPEATRQDRDAFRRYLAGLSARARLIKLADRVDNVRGLRAIRDDLEFVRRYLDETRALFLTEWSAQTHPGMARALADAYTAAALQWFEDLRLSYRPRRARVVFLGEAPPDPRQRDPRFFYSPTLSRHHYLFLGVMEALYGATFDRLAGGKADWLRRFQDAGFWMLDALEVPAESRRRADRLAALRRVAREVAERIQTVGPAVGVVICHPLADEALRPALRAGGLLLLHEGAIPFPLPPWRRTFVERVRLALMVGGIPLEIGGATG